METGQQVPSLCANKLCGTEGISSLHLCQKWVLINQIREGVVGVSGELQPSLECCSGVGKQSGLLNPRKGWT